MWCEVLRKGTSLRLAHFTLWVKWARPFLYLVVEYLTLTPNDNQELSDLLCIIPMIFVISRHDAVVTTNGGFDPCITEHRRVMEVQAESIRSFYVTSEIIPLELFTL